MSEEKTALKAVRAAFLLSVVLNTIGVVGVYSGLVGVSLEHMPVADGVVEGAGSEEATEAASRATAEALFRAPYRQAVAAGNIVVSALLAISGWMVMLRRPSSVWWVTQASLANLAWTFADVVSQASQLLSSKADLAVLYERQIRALEAEGGAEVGQLPIDGGHFVWMSVIMLSGLGVVRCLVYVWASLRVRRPDLQALFSASQTN